MLGLMNELLRRKEMKNMGRKTRNLFACLLAFSSEFITVQVIWKGGHSWGKIQS